MKHHTYQGFTLLEVLAAFLIATLSLTWFLYVLSHTYFTTTRLLERLRLFDSTTPLRAHLLEELANGKFSPEELDLLANDPEALSSYTILSPGEVGLQYSANNKEADFFPKAPEDRLQEWELELTFEDQPPRLRWYFYSWPEEEP